MNEENQLKEPINTVPSFFALSSKSLFVRVFMTAGLYLAYWNYRQWKAIKDVEAEKLSPFWRGVFSIFFIMKLTEKINFYQQKSGKDTNFDHTRAGHFYIVVFLCNYVFSRVPGAGPLIALIGLVLLIAEAAVLRETQTAINSFTAKGSEKTTLGQVAIYIGGFVLLLLYALVLLIPTEGI